MAFVVAITFTTNPCSIVIKSNWIYQFSEARNMNNGINRNQTRSIYYSNNWNDNAKFDLEVRGFFDPTDEGCYDAHLYKFFGKY